MIFSKNFLLKIRPTILIVLILLIGSVICTTLGLQYFFLEKLALKATQENFKHISQRIEQQTENLDKQKSDLISMLELHENVTTHPAVKQKHPLLPFMTNAIENNPFVYAIYLGFDNGDFYEVINLNISPTLRKKYDVSKEVRWLVLKIKTINKRRIQYEEYLDKNFTLMQSKEKTTAYDPRNRPWYKKASISQQHIKTPPYMYTNLEAAGVTYAKKIKNANVTLGIDVSLDSTSTFLKEQTQHLGQEIFLFNNMGTILGSNILPEYLLFEKNYDKKKYPYEKVIDFIMKQEQSDIHKTIQLKKGTEHFIYSKKLELASKESEFIAILLPKETIMGPYREKILLSFLITLAILTFTIPLIWYFTRILANPIQQLANENKKIQNRAFNEVKKVHTNIKELNELSHSLIDMSVSIQAFQESQKKLMHSFIKLIAEAIDAKSNYTGEHCERVPILTMMLAQEASQATHGIFKDFHFDSEEEKQELSIAAWLHDCGKVTTPEYIVDKATKLETIYNRIHEIRTRFEVLYRDVKINELEKLLSKEQKQSIKKTLEKEYEQLTLEFETVANANIGSEFMEDETINEIKRIAKRTWQSHFDQSLGLSSLEKERLQPQKNNTMYLLEDKVEHIIPRQKHLTKQYKKYKFKTEVPENLYNLGEVYNLCIKKGTLTTEDRFKINEHIMMTIIMLEQLPFPEHLAKVPEYAGAHHETLIGTGYPRQLIKEEMSIPARIMAIADIFEALTATGRPYKEAKSLSESIKILNFMVKDKHIDEDIFKLFLTSGIYKIYAKEHLQKEQIDNVDITQYL